MSEPICPVISSWIFPLSFDVTPFAFSESCSLRLSASLALGLATSVRPLIAVIFRGFRVHLDNVCKRNEGSSHTPEFFVISNLGRSRPDFLNNEPLPFWHGATRFHRSTHNEAADIRLMLTIFLSFPLAPLPGWFRSGYIFEVLHSASDCS